MANDSSSPLSGRASDSDVTVSLRKHEAPHFLADAIDAAARPVFVGDYELLDEIARGGMGIVYKARQRRLNRVVALKIARAGQFATPEELLRLEAEATAAAKLDHPNIVPIYEVGEASGRRYFSMAFVEGKSLAELIATGPLPPRRAAAILKQVAVAVAYAHRQGVIHRDLKPANILLDVEGQSRVTDFGLAKCAGSDSVLTQAGQIMGTPSFMSPEQAEASSHEVGPLSDVYSLGATLYCLVTGRPPFQAATPLETTMQVVEREPIAPRQLNPAVDRDLDTICLKCLQKHPLRRYASATALAEDLQRFLDQRPILARPVGRFEKFDRWCRRNPLVAASLTAALAVFLVAFFLVTWSYVRAENALAEELRQREEAQRREQGERWERYRANIAAAAGALQLHNVAAARRALEAAPGEHRNWEWRHFYNKLDVSHNTLELTQQAPGSLETIREADLHASGGRATLLLPDDVICFWDMHERRQLSAFSVVKTVERRTSRDGRLYAHDDVGSNKVIIRDLDGDRVAAVLTGHDQRVTSLQFSPDSSRIITGSLDGTARVWEARTGRQLQIFEGHAHEVSILNVSRDGRVVSMEGTTYDCLVWDSTSGRQIARLRGHDIRANHGLFSADGKRVLTVEAFPKNTVRLWNADTGALIAEMRGHTNQVRCVAFSPDEKLIATCGMDQTVRLWDGAGDRPVATLTGHHGWVNRVAFSPDGKQLVSASQDQTIRVWDVATGQPLAILHGHTGEVFVVAYAADGKTIVSGARDGTLRHWDAQQVLSYPVLRGHTNFAYSVAFHPDGRRLASAGWDGTVRLWDATRGKQLSVMRHGQPGIVSAVAFHPKGHWLASLGRDSAVRFWDVATAREVQSIDLPTNDWRDSRLAFSPRGEFLAAGDSQQAIHMWPVSADVPAKSAKPPQTTHLRGHSGVVREVAFSPDGRFLASGSEDYSIGIWNVDTKERVQHLTKHALWVYALAWSPDGKWLASGSNDRTVRLWDTSTWQEAAVLNHGNNVYALAFTPDGTRLAAGCADNTIRLWDMGRRQEVAELRGHDAYVHSLAFSPDGSRLASASGDFTIRLWDTLSTQTRARGE